MSKMIYDWTPGSRYPIGAQIAAERLNQIKRDRGVLTPRTVLDDARNGNSPLHKCFEWDDAKAADAYRMGEARSLIGAIVIAKIDDKVIPKETRAFLHTMIDGPRYEGAEIALVRADMRAEALAKARAEIKAWRSRYAAYSEFAQVHSAIDGLLAETSSAA